MELEHIGKSRKLLRSYPAHQHSDWELICNSCGSGTMTIDGTPYDFHPGTIVLCPPGAVHEKNAPEGFADQYIRFSGWEQPRKVYVLEDDPDKRISKLMQILHSTWYESDGRTVCQSLFSALLGLLRPALDSAPRNRFVQMLRGRIIANFTDPDFQLQDALKDIPTNGDHLRRLFKRELGQTPHDYLTSLRLEHARAILSREDVTVSEAAFRSGFYDPLYFSRLFRRHTGTAPSKWK